MFLLGDAIVARVDLKADRKGRRLIAAATWREPVMAPGSRRRTDNEIASALAAELRLAATWQGLAEVTVAPVGNLASALADALRAPAPSPGAVPE